MHQSRGMMNTLGWSRNCVRQHLHRLIAINYVAKADTTHGTIFTVVDWEQISASEEGQVMTFEGQIMTCWSDRDPQRVIS